jgi:hypothetical protein
MMATSAYPKRIKKYILLIATDAAHHSTGNIKKHTAQSKRTPLFGTNSTAWCYGCGPSTERQTAEACNHASPGSSNLAVAAISAAAAAVNDMMQASNKPASINDTSSPLSVDSSHMPASLPCATSMTY